MSGLPFILAQAQALEVEPWQWWTTGISVIAIFCALIGVSYFTRTGIIARATTKEAVRQPLFALMLFIGVLLIVVNTFLPFFSLGQDIKMLKDCGLATILISGLLLAVWTASTSIAAEIEGKTAMTLLSKPITRPQFIFGKYIGILQAVLFLLVPLIIVLCLAIFYKVGYDAKESGQSVPDMLQAGSMLPNMQRSGEVLQIMPGFALIFLEIAVLAAVSTAISTRLPMVVNMVSTFAIFVVGHITPKLVEAGTLNFEIVGFVAKLIAIVLPNLDYYNVSAAVATGQSIPPVYLLTTLGYTVAYGGAAILLSFILFEDRDLA